MNLWQRLWLIHAINLRGYVKKYSFIITQYLKCFANYDFGRSIGASLRIHASVKAIETLLDGLKLNTLSVFRKRNEIVMLRVLQAGCFTVFSLLWIEKISKACLKAFERRQSHFFASIEDSVKFSQRYIVC